MLSVLYHIYRETSGPRYAPLGPRRNTVRIRVRASVRYLFHPFYGDVHIERQWANLAVTVAPTSQMFNNMRKFYLDGRFFGIQASVSIMPSKSPYEWKKAERRDFNCFSVRYAESSWKPSQTSIVSHVIKLQRANWLRVTDLLNMLHRESRGKCNSGSVTRKSYPRLTLKSLKRPLETNTGSEQPIRM